MLPVQELIRNEKETTLRKIADKIIGHERINEEEGLLLFEKGSLPFLGMLANYTRESSSWRHHLFQPQLSYRAD